MVEQSGSLQQNKRKMLLKRREARERVDDYKLLFKFSSLTILCKCFLQKLSNGAMKFINVNKDKTLLLKHTVIAINY